MLKSRHVKHPLSATQVDAVLAVAKPSSHATWPTLWSALKPLNAPSLNKDSDILAEIKSLISKNRLYLKVCTGQVTGGANTGGAAGSGGAGRSSSLEPTNLGPASQDRHDHGEGPESTGTPHAEETATVLAQPSKDGDQKIADTETGGDPVSMVTGEEMLQYNDITLPGPMPFAWKRTYRSSHTRDIGLGVAWSHSGSEYLELDEDTVTYVDDEGRAIPFNAPIVNQRSKYIPEGLNLDRLSDTAFVLKQEGQWDKLFTRPSATTSTFRLTQLRHQAYAPAKTLFGVTTAESGFCIKFHYNDQNRVSRIQGNWGKSLRITRNPQGRVQAINLNNDTLNQQKRVAQYHYNTEGDLVAHLNAKGVGEKYHYKNHLISQRTLATGFTFYFEWDGEDSSARCIHNWGDRGIYEYHFDWDKANNRSKATDSRGFQCEYHYNKYGQIEEHIDNEGGVHHTRFVNGRKDAYIDPEGHTTEYYYDRDNNPAGVRDPLGHSTTISYFKGRATTYIDKGKALWRREYNRKGQLISLTDPVGEATHYSYTAQGLVASVTDPLNRKTHYRWNVQGELTAIADALGHTRAFRYDPWGQVVAMDFLIDGKTLAGTTHYGYSTTGRIEKVTAANGEVTNYTYNDNDQLIRHSDPQGRTTEFVYDGLSQVIERIDAEGQRLKYEYDTERNLTALINEKGERYQFFYDGNERLTKEIGFDGRVQHYKYNKAGHLIKHMDAGEVLTEFERDALGQMRSKICTSIKAPNTPAEHVRYQYDANGRLQESYNQHQFLRFEYNALGGVSQEHHSDLNSKKQRIQDCMVDINFANIWPGQRSGISLPDGQQIHYQFDDYNRFTGITLNQQNITTLERDAFGRETARHQGDLTTHSHYDPMGRLQQQSSVNKQHKAPGPIQREYGYNKFGNLSQLIDGSQETRFVYDLVNRLEKVEGRSASNTTNSSTDGSANNSTNSQSETFSFDPASNLVGINGAPISQSEGNRLAMQGDRKFTYDARGNLIQENRGKEGKLHTYYHYNLQNQLVKVNKYGQVTEYKYDPLGRRIEKKDAFGKTQYLWAGDQLTQETRNNIKKTYIYEPESFKPVAMVQDGEVYHYHLDHLGTPKELTDQEGKVVWKVSYKTYGNVALKEVEEVENNLRFQGQYFDEETGLHYNRHRYYNPNTGQFTQQDPIGLLGGVNGYQYAPNPVGWVDPLGLKSKDCPPTNTWNAFQSDHKEQFANVSTASKAYAELKQQQSPWPIGFTPPEATILPGAKFQMALSPGQPLNHPGAFGTFDEIQNVNYVRKDLAVKEAWKPQVDKVVTYEVIAPLPVLIGPVGPQVDEVSKTYLPGGGGQIEMNVPRNDRMKYIKVSSEKPIK